MGILFDTQNSTRKEVSIVQETNHINSKKGYGLKLPSLSIWRLLGGSSFLALTLIALFTICPIAPQDINAITNTTTSTEASIVVQATASISVSLSPQVNIDVTPTSTGTFGLNNAELGISTNNTEGYKIFLYTSDGSGKLKNIDTSKLDGEGNVYAISSITQTMSGTSFPSNTWGYALEPNASTITKESNFSAVPTSSSSYIKNVTSVNVNGTDIHEDKYNLAFGTAISTALPAGTYSNSVVISVVANPTTITSLGQLVYMQDMNSSICNNTVYADGTSANEMYRLNPVTKQLIDVRDGKRYWVAKLADGNCWMTQNLALDLDPTRPLTPSDSDVSSNWTPKTKTITAYTTETATNSTPTVSWNLGLIALNNPTTDYWAEDTCYELEPGQPLTTCSHYTNVEGFTDSATGWDETKTVNYEAKTYDSHYLVGNYYSWSAATAESYLSLEAENEDLSLLSDPNLYQNAPDSICPKGWQLANVGRKAQSMPIKSIYIDLLAAYGYPQYDNTGTDDLTSWNTSTSVPTTSVAGGSKIRVDWAPIYLVRSGYITTPSPTEPSEFHLDGAGQYLSSSLFPGNMNDLFYTFLRATAISPGSSYGQSTEFGRSVRCLAR